MKRRVMGVAAFAAVLAVLCVCAGGRLFGKGDAAAERPAAWAERLTVAGVPNLHRVDEGLYRSAQPTAEGMTNLVALGVKTVVNLRHFHSDADEVGGLPLAMRRIAINTWNPKTEYARTFLSIATNESARPVLVHCQHGADRTGAMTALYRIVHQGWSVDEALREMTEGGYGYHSVWSHLPGYVRETAAKLRRQ